MVSKPPSKGYEASWSVESQTESGKVYTVSRRPRADDGVQVWACSCPAWKFHTAPKPDCKHIESVKEAIQQANDCAVAVARAIGARPEPWPVPRREVAQPPTSGTVQLRLNGDLIGWIPEAEAERLRATYGPQASRKPPVTDDVMIVGTFTIKRKFRLGGDQ